MVPLYVPGCERRIALLALFPASCVVFPSPPGIASSGVVFWIGVGCGVIVIVVCVVGSVNVMAISAVRHRSANAM